MDKRLWVAGFSLVLVLSAAACSEVEHCEPGTDGCLGAECSRRGECQFDLECVSTGTETLCGEKLDQGNGYNCGDEHDGCQNAVLVGGDPDGGADDGGDPDGGDPDGGADDGGDPDGGDPDGGADEGGGPDGGDPDGGVDDGGSVDGGGDLDDGGPLTCNCTGPDELCAPGTTDVCVNYCEDPGFAVSVEERRSTQNLPCRTDGSGNPVSYLDACRATWRQFCLGAEAYCADHQGCKLALFGSGPLPQNLLEWCRNNYPDQDAISGYCETLRDSTCASFPECTAENPKACTTTFLCTNTCRFALDGACDDGDLATAAFADCDWGTDCGDCGPRSGTPPVLPVVIGGLCFNNTQCDGHSDDLRTNKSWCLPVNGPGTARCMSDCTRDNDCPDGYSCAAIVDPNGDAIVQDDLVASACGPLICE